MSLPSIESDQIMQEVFHKMQFDLAGWTRDEVKALRSVKEVREFEYTIPKYGHPYAVKANLQIAGLLKRYIFKDDVFTADELEVLTNNKFLSEQKRIGTIKPLKHRSFIVVQEARKLIKNILGPWPGWLELNKFGQFSRNACVGFSGDEVYLDRKVNPSSWLTGTAAELDVFVLKILPYDDLLKSCVSDKGGDSLVWNTLSVNSLKQINVPKSAKILRPVRPNTLVGSYLSLAIGNYIVHRLETEMDYELTERQPFHRYLACKGSKTLKNCTTDMKSASDNFVSYHMNMLLPREWFVQLKQLRTPFVELNGTNIWSPSFMAMGIGYTFSLMSLVFLCLLLSLQKLCGIPGRISVFGDDLIYPRGLHGYVEKLFYDLNFYINSDKTFASDVPFRESCGGDFYCGSDVRPACPKGVSELLKGEVSICAYVYKLFNSLILRWKEVELPRTFEYLRSIISNLGCRVFSVPPHFPDSSGLKDGLWRTFAKREVPSSNLRKPFYNGLVVDCLVERGLLRPAGFTNIYFYEKLKTASCSEEGIELSKKFWDKKYPDITPTDVLVWRKEKSNRRVLSRRHKCSYRKMHAFTTKKDMRYIEISSKVVS